MMHTSGRYRPGTLLLVAIVLAVAAAGLVMSFRPSPDKISALLMPRGFEGVYLNMSEESLLESRPTWSESRQADWEERLPGHQLSLVRYYFQPNPFDLEFPDDSDSGSDRIRRLVRVRFYGEGERVPAMSFLSECVDKYGPDFEKLYDGEDNGIRLLWRADGGYVSLDVWHSQERDEHAVSLCIESKRCYRWTQGRKDAEGIHDAFAPYQPTIDQALKELAVREEVARGEAAREEARQRNVRIALYSGLAVVLILAAVIAYRRFIRRSSHDSKAA